MKVTSIAWLLFLLREQTAQHGVAGFVPRPMVLSRSITQHADTGGRHTTTTSASMARVPYHPPPPPPPPLPQSPLEQLNSFLDGVFGNIPDLGNIKMPSLPSLDAISSPQLFDGDFDLGKILSSTMSSDFDLSKTLSSITSQLQSVDKHTMEQLTAFSTQIQDWLHTSVPSAEPVYVELVKQISSLNEAANLSPSLVATVATLWTATTVISLVAGGDEIGTSSAASPYPLKKYDPVSARLYFRKRLPQVIGRGLQVLSQSLSFALNVLGDNIKQNDGTPIPEETENARGLELAQLLTVLGPTYIKVGQSLSIRTDLLSPAYVRGLATLQDQVPPFDSDIAFDTMKDEWGVSNIYDVVSQITPEPIAAASLGQVYKATLKEDGREVAIKVQRPNIMNQIALDMHLLREIAPVLKSLFNLNTDAVGVVDTWGKGFVDELDYLEEARNGQLFMEEIQRTPLKDVVFAPTVVDDISTGKVLVTEWVDGERLDESSSEDVTILCSIAMNTYLTMLLELGLLHCDPHPGNLLRSKKDGRLCILDWGMVTRLNENLQLTLIEHVAHLTSSDYEEIPRDLLLLDFIPKDKEHLINDSDLVYVLADIYGAWSKGGGAAAVNVNDVVNQLQDLTAKKGNLFQIPPYFAYIAKSFSVLEGIGLSNDEKYSIINECLPYISQRLLTDEEKMGPALSTFIFGPEKNNVKTRIIDYDRVEQLVTGFGNYTSSAAAVALLSSSASAVAAETEALKKDSVAVDDNSIFPSDSATTSSSTSSNTKLIIEKASEQILDLLFAEEETPFQTILLEQVAKIVASSSRSVFTQVRESSGVLPSGRTVLGSIIDPLGLFRTSPLVRMNEMDDRVVDNTRKLLTLVQTQQQQLFGDDLSTLGNDLSREDIVYLSQTIIQKVWSRRVGILRTGNRFTRELLTLFADKLERGERDTRKLPKAPVKEEEEENEDDKNEESNSGSVNNNNAGLREDIKNRMVVEEADPTTARARATSRGRAAAAASAAAAAAARRASSSDSTATTDSTSRSSENRLSNARKLLDASAVTPIAAGVAPTKERPSRRSNSHERLSNARKLLDEINNTKDEEEDYSASREVETDNESGATAAEEDIPEAEEVVAEIVVPTAKEEDSPIPAEKKEEAVVAELVQQ